jgi:hypothetical protein
MSKPTDFFYWNVPDERRPGKTRRSACRMTREDAAAQYGGTATPIPGSLEVRDLPETDAERMALTHTGRGKATPGA